MPNLCCHSLTSPSEPHVSSSAELKPSERLNCFSCLPSQSAPALLRKLPPAPAPPAPPWPQTLPLSCVLLLVLLQLPLELTVSPMEWHEKPDKCRLPHPSEPLSPQPLEGSDMGGVTVHA